MAEMTTWTAMVPHVFFVGTVEPRESCGLFLLPNVSHTWTSTTSCWLGWYRKGFVMPGGVSLFICPTKHHLRVAACVRTYVHTQAKFCIRLTSLPLLVVHVYAAYAAWLGREEDFDLMWGFVTRDV
jgi:type IV secretory pathway protease TraF